MKYSKLGQTEMKASVVGLGAWVLGGGPIWGQETDDAESVRAIHAALDAGINLIDTAPAYGWGRSEEVVGKAIKGRRDSVILATKCGLWWEDSRGSFFTELAGKELRRSLRPDTIQIEIENSLKRLDTDWIDLYQTHWPSMPPDQTPIAETMSCLLKLKDQGKIRAIGVCNVTPAELEENLARGPIASDQFRYSMLYRDPEKDILPLCAEKNVATLTYMSLEQGLLTGKVGMDRQFSATEFRSNEFWNPWFIPENRRRVLDLLAGWKELTDRHQCTLAQLVLGWTLAQPGVTHVLGGARTEGQAQENVHAAAITLRQEEIHRIRADLDSLGTPQTSS